MQNQKVHNGIIDVPLGVSRIRKLYNFASSFYFLANPIEKKARMRALELAHIKPEDKVLEVAVGPGFNFLEIIKKVNGNNVVHGIDLSPKMLEKTRRLVKGRGFSNFDLREADARRLPFPGETFDVLYNSYMLDLIPLDDFAVVLSEFYRLMKKNGRLALVNFSKKDSSPILSERLYRVSPSLWFGCRPVLMESFVKQAGFRNVKREIPKNPLPSEIVTGLK